MERFNALGRGTQLMLVGAVLLLIDSFFRWQEISIDVLGVEASTWSSLPRMSGRYFSRASRVVSINRCFCC